MKLRIDFEPREEHYISSISAILERGERLTLTKLKKQIKEDLVCYGYDYDTILFEDLRGQYTKLAKDIFNELNTK